MTLLRPLLAAVALVGFTLSSARAQCAIQGQAGSPLPQLRGPVAATLPWDPDGAGPAPLQLVVAGAHLTGGSLLSVGVATFDGSQWLPLGTPPTDVATSLGVFNGQLVAAFDLAGGPVQNQLIATWNGSGWQNLGTVQQGHVQSMTVYNGELVAAGNFALMGSLPAGNIAKWNGSTWSTLGSGVVGQVLATAVYSGLLYAGGDLTLAGGVPLSSLAVWNGSTWSPAGNPNGTVRSLSVRTTTSITTSHLFAGGSFTTIGGFSAQHVARFNTSTNAWTPLGAGLPGSTCQAVYVRATGLSSYELTAATEDLSGANQVLRWSGSVWSGLGGTLPDAPRTLAYFGGRYLLGQAATGTSLRAYDGASWLPVVGPGIDGSVFAILDQGTDLIIGGSFRSISGTTMNGVARGNVGAWSPLGSGVDGTVRALVQSANGDVIVGGDFTTASGQPTSHVARWNSSTWTPMGAGTTDTVHALARMPNGDLIAGGAFAGAGGGLVNHVARWNGSAWSTIAGGLNGTVRALLTMPNGDLIAGGDFTIAGSVTAIRIARTDGTAWFPVGTGMDGPVHALARLPNGNLVAGGAFVYAGGAYSPKAAFWNGAYWDRFQGYLAAPLQGHVHALCMLPNDDPIAGGVPAYVGATMTGLARLAARTWTSLSVPSGEVNAIVARANGEVFVGGSFGAAGGLAAGSFARLATPCPATVVSYGNGCSGSAGPLAFVATELPWTGGAYRASATGLAPNSLAVDLLGFASAAVPLSVLHPAGGAGCSLLVTAVATQLWLPANGRVDVVFHIPADPLLLGAILRDQVLQIEIGANADITGLSSTNGLELSIGIF